MADADEVLLADIVRKKQFHHVYQPLYILSNRQVYGYEALLRCKFFSNPEQLFQLAMRKNKLFDLDCCSIVRALTSFTGRKLRLFVNVFPSTMVHPRFPHFLKTLQSVHSVKRRIVFEINEAEKVSNIRALRKTVDFLKEQGYAVAVDDFGKGESSLQTVIALKPDFVKLDRRYARDLSGSTERQNEIQTLLTLCRHEDMRLILEGIEQPTDFAKAEALGVHLGQGYLLGKPMPAHEID